MPGAFYTSNSCRLDRQNVLDQDTLSACQQQYTLMIVNPFELAGHCDICAARLSLVRLEIRQRYHGAAVNAVSQR